MTDRTVLPGWDMLRFCMNLLQRSGFRILPDSGWILRQEGSGTGPAGSPSFSTPLVTVPAQLLKRSGLIHAARGRWRR